MDDCLPLLASVDIKIGKASDGFHDSVNVAEVSFTDIEGEEWGFTVTEPALRQLMDTMAQAVAGMSLGDL